MYETEFLVTLWIAGGLAFWVALLKWSNRRLRKKLSAVELKLAATAARLPIQQASPLPPPQRDPEIDQLRQRLAVERRIVREPPEVRIAPESRGEHARHADSVQHLGGGRGHLPRRITRSAREDFHVVPVAHEMLGQVSEILASGRDVRRVMLIDEQERSFRGAIHRRFTGRLTPTGVHVLRQPLPAQRSAPTAAPRSAG